MSLTSLRSARLILADPMAAHTGPELTALVIFCVLGLLVTVAVNLLVPNFGETITSVQPFL